MKTICLIACFLIVQFKSLGQDKNSSLTDTTEISEVLKSNWKEWHKYKSKLLKKVSYSKDSVETYYIDKKSKQTILIHVFKQLIKGEVETVDYYYLNNVLFRAQFFKRSQNKLGIWQDKESGLYFFSNTDLIFKRESMEIHRTPEFLRTHSNQYYEISTKLSSDL